MAKVLFFSALLGFGTGLLLSEIVDHYFRIDFGNLIAVPVGILIWYFMLSRDMNREIRESRQRMRDPKYRDLLHRLQIDGKSGTNP